MLEKEEDMILKNLIVDGVLYAVVATHQNLFVHVEDAVCI